jgi:rhamnopyranosyl-N-acetylglucosaminyl-diphospho-decaprenol beta-1,3/1,4-galactofuranosyltransferase
MTVKHPPGSGADLHKSKVAAVFATMNRSGVACECLRLLAGQSTLPGKIFVTDNASSDGTVEALESEAVNLGVDVSVLRPAENLGNAGGIQLAMDLAFEEGFDHVWILDDDSWPERDALSALLAQDGPTAGIRTSLVLEPDSNRVSWPCEIRRPQEEWKMVQSVPKSQTGWHEIRRSWLGSLISREAYLKIGPVNADLFLRGEDEEYPRRLEKAGYRFWVSSASILRHPVAGPLLTLSFGDYKLCLENNLGADKLYYRIRNMVWIKGRESGKITAAILASGYFLLLLRWFRPFRPASGIFIEAVRDAFTGRLGKRRKG